jgi:hypothetical protein
MAPTTAPSVSLAPLALGGGRIIATLASPSGISDSSLRSTEAAELARLRKIARKHRHGAWTTAETARLTKYQAIAEKRQKVAIQFPKAPAEGSSERKVYDSLIAETVLSPEVHIMTASIVSQYRYMLTRQLTTPTNE